MANCCAIYTRTSSEEGLSQEFNSLDAQRECGEAYIRSQRQAGWTLLPTRYDDGGFTGANGREDPFDPRQNIDSGARFLKQLLTRYGGDVSLALGAYNAGPARVDATGGLPAIEETLHYVQTILGNLPIH